MRKDTAGGVVAPVLAHIPTVVHIPAQGEGTPAPGLGPAPVQRARSPGRGKNREPSMTPSEEFQPISIFVYLPKSLSDIKRDV